MPVVSSQYWNMVYGQTPGKVKQDEDAAAQRSLLRPLKV
jgi:hypothetical protein